MSMELLAESDADAVQGAGGNGDSVNRSVNGPVDEQAPALDLSEAETGERQSVRYTKKPPWKRAKNNVDPLFYFTLVASAALLVLALSWMIRHHSGLMAGYRAELDAGEANLSARLAEVDELDTAVADESSGLQPAKQSPATEVVVQAESVTRKTSIVRPAGLHTEEALNQGVSNQSTGDTVVETASLENDGDESDRVEVGAGVDEVEALRALLSAKSEQIEVLAQENHELRVLLQFGGADAQPQPGKQRAFDMSDDDAFVVQDEKDLIASEITSVPAAAATSGDSAPVTGVVSPVNQEMQHLLDIAESAFTGGSLQMAADWYHRALQRDPMNRDANMGVAATASALGQHRLAASRYRHLLSIDPLDQEAFAAMLAIAASDNMIATELLTHIADRAGSSASLYAIVGHHYGRESQWNRASDAYQKAVQNPDDGQVADHLYNLAVSLEHTDRGDEALVYYLQALQEVERDNTSAGFDRGLVRRRIELLGHQSGS